MVYDFEAPLTVTSRVESTAKVVVAARAAVPVRAAPDVAWMTSTECAPMVSPAPADRPEKPSPLEPLATRTGPPATTLEVDATVPVEAIVPARDSCWTVKLSTPERAPDVAVATTAVLDELAFITRQSDTRLRVWAPGARLANFGLRAWDTDTARLASF